jgi:hypothetical protein
MAPQKPASATLREIIARAVDGSAAKESGRLRITIVGRHEEHFLVQLAPSNSRVKDDEDGPTDATLWIRKDDVSRILDGWELGGVRRAGKIELVEALVALLVPGKSALTVFSENRHAHR